MEGEVAAREVPGDRSKSVNRKILGCRNILAIRISYKRDSRTAVYAEPLRRKYRDESRDRRARDCRPTYIFQGSNVAGCR